MTPVRSVLQAVRSWLRRRGGPKTPKRAVAALEQLDHRQLLSVNFTGIVTTDFPDTLSPGVVILRADAEDQIATPDADLAPLIPTSGFAVNAIRLTYDPADDSLSFGLEQPLSGRGTGLPVIAGDADDNGDETTVNPEVLAVTPSFRDPADLGGTETMAVFLDLNQDGVADIVAGKPQISFEQPKLYQVAIASNTPGSNRPDFGPILPNNTGTVYLVNDPRHPGFEFEITNFSQLYQAFNPGQTLSPDDIISVGAFAGSLQDGSVSETFINFKSFEFGKAIRPIPECPPCPPVSPPILVNPHEWRHINTAHRTYIRVYVLGSSGFNVDNIINETVVFGGASPAFAYNRHLNADPYADRVFIFPGEEVSFPGGLTLATLSGELVDGTKFVSQIPVFNRDASFYPVTEIMLGGGPMRGSRPAENRAALRGSNLTATAAATQTIAEPTGGLKSTGPGAMAWANRTALRRARQESATSTTGWNPDLSAPVVRIPMRSNEQTRAMTSGSSVAPTVRIPGAARGSVATPPLSVVIPAHFTVDPRAR